MRNNLCSKAATPASKALAIFSKQFVKSTQAYTLFKNHKKIYFKTKMFKSNIFKFLRKNPSLDNFWHENSSEIFLSNFKTMCQDFTSKSSVFPKKMDVVIQCVQVGPAKKSNFKSHCNDCNIICSILLIQGVPASFFFFFFFFSTI